MYHRGDGVANVGVDGWAHGDVERLVVYRLAYEALSTMTPHMLNVLDTASYGMSRRM